MVASEDNVEPVVQYNEHLCIVFQLDIARLRVMTLVMRPREK